MVHWDWPESLAIQLATIEPKQVPSGNVQLGWMKNPPLCDS